MAEEDTKVPVKKIPLQDCINFWEAKLFHDQALMSPEMALFIERTIDYLKGAK